MLAGSEFILDPGERVTGLLEALFCILIFLQRLIEFVFKQLSLRIQLLKLLLEICFRMGGNLLRYIQFLFKKFDIRSLICEGLFKNEPLGL